MRSTNPCVTFDGLNFYRTGKNRYFWNRHGLGRGTSRSLHRHVWEHHHGPIPDGMTVHHIVRDYATTDVAHLALMPASEHARLHALERVASGGLKPPGPKALAAATRWHGSAEGASWHSHAAKAAWKKRRKIRMACTRCGKTYQSYEISRKKGFCSMSCQGMARIASGVDDEIRSCVMCGTRFAVNRYRKTKTCSAVCAGRSQSRTKARLSLR